MNQDLQALQSIVDAVLLSTGRDGPLHVAEPTQSMFSIVDEPKFVTMDSTAAQDSFKSCHIIVKGAGSVVEHLDLDVLCDVFGQDKDIHVIGV